MAWFKRKGLSTEVMIELEDKLNKSKLHVLGADKDDNDLAKEFKLQVMFVNDADVERDTEARLEKPEDDGYNGLIRIRESLRPMPFAFTHEIMHYVFDVGVGEVVQKTFARKVKGVDKSEHEQWIDYLAAANRMRYDNMVSEISRYDESSPRMNPVSFVNHLCNTYNVDRTSAIRRVQEVRAIMARRNS